MIRSPAGLEPPASRLIAALAGREAGDIATLALGLAPGMDTARLPALASETGARRILVLSLLGAHPDARSDALRALWDLEEAARATALPTLTVRLAPLLGVASPLWLRLRSRPRIDRPQRLLCPLFEDDALAALERALAGQVVWDGCYEAAGQDPIALGELAALARRAPAPDTPGAWEPPLAVLAEQRLADPEPWITAFGVTPAPLVERLERWAA